MVNWQKFSSGNFDWLLAAAVFLLSVLGLAAIYSVDLSRGSDLIYFKKQLIALGLSVVLLFAASLVQHTFFKNYAKWWYLCALLALVVVLFFGQTIRGTTGWFSFSGFSFQPVEFAKVGLVLALAAAAANAGRRFDRPFFFFGAAALAFALVLLVLFQPDLGSACLLAALWFGVMLLIGARRIFLVSTIIAVIAIGAFAWAFLLKDFQKDRVLSFIEPNRDPLGSGYNVIQSVIAVGSGGVFGRGLGFGSQSQLRFLPEAQTDFIFSVVGEELGLAGLTVMLGLYGVVFWRLARLAREANDDFVAAVSCGAIVLFFVQLFVNASANTGLLPVTGVTLPFVSYGGSSLMMNFLLIGIVESFLKKKY